MTISKWVTPAVRLADGTYRAGVKILIENSGDEPLFGVQVRDAIRQNIEPATVVAIEGLTMDGSLSELDRTFDGVSRINLLSGMETLKPGKWAEVRFDLLFDPQGAPVPLQNVASGEANDRSGNRVVDVCSLQSKHRTTGGAGCEPALIVLPDEPILGLAKSASVAQFISREAGFETQLRFEVRNLGTMQLTGLQIYDDLAEVFTGAVAFEVLARSIETRNLTANPAFDGKAQRQLLSGNDRLAPDESGVITLKIRFRPIDASGVYFNQAKAVSAEARDYSTDGQDPDPDGDGWPDEAQPTPIHYELPASGLPVIGLAKESTEPEALAEGGFETRISFVVENFSDVTLTDVQIVDDLAAVFGADTEFQVLTDTFQATGLVPDTRFDGSGHTRMLRGDDSVGPRQTASVSVLVRFFPSLAEGSVRNQAMASAVGTEDLSTSGRDPDPNGDDVPDEQETTTIRWELPTPAPPVISIGLANAASDTTRDGDAFRTTLSYVLRNFGDLALTELAIENDLRQTFTGTAEFEVQRDTLRATPGVQINTVFDGKGQTNLFGPDNSIGPGEQIDISVDVVFEPGEETSPFWNQSEAAGREPDSGVLVSDRSTNGLEPDPGGDGVPEEAEPTPIPFQREPALLSVTKVVESTSVGETGFEIAFRIRVENSGGEPISNLQVMDNLRQAFPEPVTIVVREKPSITGALTQVNDSFGVGNSALLSGAESLPPGAWSEIRFTIAIELNGATGPFYNQALGSGVDPRGEPVFEDSNDGEPTPVELPGAFEGLIYRDSNHNRQHDSSDAGAGGWILDIQNADGAPVSSLTADVDGRIAPQALPPGRYRFLFRNPYRNVTWAMGEVVLEASDRFEFEQPVDPSGVVYESGRRLPVADAVLSLIDESTGPLPDTCLLPGQQNQQTDAEGAYRFDVQFGAAPECQSQTVAVRIAVLSAPGDLVAGPSTLIEPAAEALQTSVCSPGAGLPCIVQQQTGPPETDASTDYYLDLLWRAGDEGIANNHIPLDGPEDVEPPQGGTVVVRHFVDRARARIGDVVGYRSLVENVSSQPVSSVTLREEPPAGFNALGDSLVLVRAGPDGVLGTPDDETFRLPVLGPREFEATVGDLAPGEQVEIRYAARISPAVQPGIKISKAVGLVGPDETDRGTASLLIEADPLFEKTTVIGKVFHDQNANGEQDEGEPGIPGVRLATLDGLVIETDKHGRYHIADVDTGRTDRSANFMIKLDALSLPENRDASRVLRQVVRLTPGLMTKVNFPVRTRTPPSVLPTVLSRSTDSKLPLNPADLTEAMLRQLLENVTLAENRTDPLRFEPKLDVLALNEVVRGDEQRDVEVRFAVFSNYHRFINRYELAVYDVTDPLFARRINRIVPVTVERLSSPFDLPDSDLEKLRLRTLLEGRIRGASGQIPDPGLQLFVLGVKFELPARTRRLAYRLIAFGHCDPTIPERQDRTYLRLIDLAEPSAATRSRTRQAEEILGHSSLARQNIVVRGQRNLTTNEVLRPPRLRKTLELGEDVQPVPVPGTRRLSGQQLQATYGLTPEGGHPETDRRQIDLDDKETWAVFDHEGLERGQSGFIEFNPERIVLVDEGDYADDDNATGVHEVTLVCGCSRVSAETIVDRAQNSLSLRLTNYGDLQENPEVTFDKRKTISMEAMAPGTTQEIFLGAFEADEIRSEIDWESIMVVLGAVDESGVAPAFELRRKRRAGEFAPDIWAMCENIAARPHTTTEENQIASMVVEDRNPVATPTALFAMGLINLTAGLNEVSGNLQSISDDDHFDETVYIDGRVAGYLKGKIRGRYLITAQLDTTEDALKNLGNNLSRTDSSRIFRQLDPDRYYPIYGDDSTAISDVDTQGAMYLRLDWDKSSALWGNFNTGLTDTEFSQYNRSLYGGKVDFNSVATNQYGDPRMALKLFGSEAQTLSAHATFRATGGSLYYLPHRDIVQGSEKLWVEVRARDSEQVLDTEVLLPGRDYEVDDIQGRVLLARPLAMIVRERSNTIIRTTPLDGDRVFLLADYEHVPRDFTAGEITSGARGKWSGDHLSIGLSSVTDQRDGRDYELLGTDLTWRMGARSYVRGEFADSNAGQNDLNSFSYDGGLSFTDERAPVDRLAGNAYGVEVLLDLNEFNPDQTGEFRAWHKNKDEGFSAGRLGELRGYEDTGFSLDNQLNDNWSISASAASLEREVGTNESNARIQTEIEVGACNGKPCFQLGLEGRYESFEGAVDPGVGVPAGTRDGDAVLVGARVGKEIRRGTTVYGGLQTALDQSAAYVDNDLFSLGVNQRMTKQLAISVEGSDGDRGSALMGGVEYQAKNGAPVNLSGGIGSGATTQFGSRYSIAEGHEVYGTYTMDPDRTDGARNQSTLGQRSQLGSRVNVFNETTFGRDADYADTAHVFGLEFDATESWLVTADIQASSIKTDAADIDRRVFSLGTSNRQSGWRLASRFEVRADTSQELDTRQYLTSTRFGLGQMDDTGRWIGKLNLAWTDDRAGGSEDGRFVEFDLGYAHRPIENDRWNWLAKYSFLYDLGSNGQLGPNGRSDEQLEERSHVASAEVLYDLGGGIELGAKLAGKVGEQRAFAEGEWYDSRLAFASVRGRYRLPGTSEDQSEGHWEALLEYRALRDFKDGSTRSGALLGVYRSMKNGQLKVGVGYNFTDFDGDLKGSDYRSGGWFLDVSAAY